MKKKVVSILLAAIVAAGTAACGSGTDANADNSADVTTNAEAGGDADTKGGTDANEGKVINIYSWNNEFSQRVQAVYSEVKETSADGTVTYLNDGTEIHWIINPNQDGVYQQKLDEALLNQADAAADDKVDIFLSETD